MTKICVFDVDGTIADIEHRRHFVATKPRNWPAFNKAMVHDTPHDDIIWLYKTLQAAGCTMLIASGRGEEDREKTINWLQEQDIEFVKLYMRPAKDSRRDSIIKTEILEQIRKDFGEPFMVFDDRDQVVTEAWRANGIRCLQVAPGNF